MNANQPNEQPELVLTHVFNAPKELVFNSFSTAEAMGEWWGPVEMKNTPITLDFRTGGIFHFKMEGHGQTNYGRFLFGKIEPHDFLEFTNAFADEHANIIKAPFDINLPKEIHYQLSFSEKDGKTTLHLTGKALHATEEECEVFRSINANVQEGFGATFSKLENYLEKIKS